jgi:hypothetical protein
MSTQENVQIVKDFFAAMGSGDRQALLALSAEGIEWIIPLETSLLESVLITFLWKRWNLTRSWKPSPSRFFGSRRQFGQRSLDFDYFAWSRKPQPVAPVTY